MKRPGTFVLAVSVGASSVFLAACETTTSGGQPAARTKASVHVGYGRGPWWGWGGYYPPVIITPPEPELPIAPEPPIAVPLPDYGDGDFGGGDFGGFEGDFGGGDFGGGDFGGGDF